MHKKGDKLICIKTDNSSAIKVGNEYIFKEYYSTPVRHNNIYQYVTDFTRIYIQGNINTFICHNFVTLKEYRKMKLEKLKTL